MDCGSMQNKLSHTELLTKFGPLKTFEEYYNSKDYILVKKYMGNKLRRKYEEAYRYWLQRKPYDAICDEALWRAVQNHNDNKSRSFWSSFMSILEAKIFHDISNKSRMAHQQYVIFKCSKSVTFSEENNIINKELVAHYLNFLNEREKFCIIKKYLEGYTLQEVGEMLGISGKRVQQIRNRAFQKLRAKFNIE